SLYPVRLDPGGIDLDDALAGGPALGRAIKSNKEQLREGPDRGLGYGLLRYLNEGTAPGRRAPARPPPRLNYPRRVQGFAMAMAMDWAAADEAAPRDGLGDPALPLAHAIEINALTLDQASGPQLVASWTYAAALISEAEVRDLAQGWFDALQALVRHAAAPGAGGRAAADLPLVALSQKEIERLERAYAR